MMKPDTPKFALLPVEPSDKMAYAGSWAKGPGGDTEHMKVCKEIYRAMISAAPNPDCVGVEELRLKLRGVIAPYNAVNGFHIADQVIDLIVSEGLLAVKEKAQTAEDDLRMFGQSFERISEDGKRTRISPLDVYDKAQERGEHPCDWQDEETKGGRS